MILFSHTRGEKMEGCVDFGSGFSFLIGASPSGGDRHRSVGFPLREDILLRP